MVTTAPYVNRNKWKRFQMEPHMNIACNNCGTIVTKVGFENHDSRHTCSGCGLKVRVNVRKHKRFATVTKVIASRDEDLKIRKSLRIPGHKLTIEWSGEYGVESTSTGTCTCGWQESASNQNEVRFEYREHLRAWKEGRKNFGVGHEGMEHY